MVTIKPLEDREKVKKILEDIPEAEKDAEILVMDAGDEILGWVAVDCVHSVLRMLRMNLQGRNVEDPPKGFDQMNADSLMRAAASYGANHGTYRIQCRIPALYEQLRISGFQEENGFAVADLDRIVRYTGKK